MVTYDVQEQWMKSISTRWRLHASVSGCLLLTSGASFMVTVEPDCVVVWRLVDNDEVAFRQYNDNQYPADDLHDSDQDFCYDDGDNDVSAEQVPALLCCC